MAAVLAVSPYLAFYDNDGKPLAGGLIYTYAAGTSFMVPKATYTDSTAVTPMSNPIVLDGSGRTTFFVTGSYGYVVKDALGNTIRTTDNVTSFTTLGSSNPAFFQSFSGTGSQNAFTASSNLGTDSKNLLVFVGQSAQQAVANGDFSTDTIWTKGAGWTISGGVANATGAISTAISQNSLITLVAGQVYSVTYTITQSAGSITPSLGGNSGTIRNTAGTYREVIVAGTTQVIAFTGTGFTGTLDNISIITVDTAGMEIQPPSAFTINGTTLSFAVAPPLGTNNIYVFAPSLLLGAASAAADAATAAASAAATSAMQASGYATSALGFSNAKNKWIFSNNTAMAAPGTGNIRFNNATLSSVTAIAIADLSANTGNPDMSPWVLSWDSVTGATVRGTLYIYNDQSNFVFYQITGATTSNTGWRQLAVTFLNSAGTISDANNLYLGFNAAGSINATGGITAINGVINASGSGSVSSTFNNNVVTNTVLAQGAANTIKANATAALANETDFAVTTNSAVGRLAANIVNIPIGTGANNLVSLDASSKLPAVDGSALTNLPSGITTATPVTFSATTSTVITVDFTTYCAYKLYVVIPSAAVTMVVTQDYSQNAGGSYLTTNYSQQNRITNNTLTNTSTNIGSNTSSTNAMFISEDIYQPSTAADIYAHSSTDGVANMQQYGVVTAPSTAAVNRIRLNFSASTSGFYSLIPIAKR